VFIEQTGARVVREDIATDPGVELDHGPIVVQKAVPVLDTDDEHSLAARILEQEHIAYTEAINIVLDGRLQIAGRSLVL
jgi:phosphoribosylglycinamide formyltransferase-1